MIGRTNATVGSTAPAKEAYILVTDIINMGMTVAYPPESVKCGSKTPIKEESVDDETMRYTVDTLGTWVLTFPVSRNNIEEVQVTEFGKTYEVVAPYEFMGDEPDKGDNVN